MSNKSVVVQIGNTDDKLRQTLWSAYYHNVDELVERYAKEIHFCGGPLTVMPWQNYCWVFIADSKNIDDFKKELARLRKDFFQDSVALLVGDTEFV